MKNIFLKEIFTILFAIIFKKKYSKNLKWSNKWIKKSLLIKKGSYLTIIGNCISCHTLNGGKPFSGGVALKTNFGVIHTPNITPNIKFGIGMMNLTQFNKIMKNGLSVSNNFLYPAFPFLNYTNIHKKDIKCIYFFLKNIKKEKIPNKKNYIKFPFKYKKLLIIWRVFFFKKKLFTIYNKSFSKNRGMYIVEGLGHCDMCHTKNNLLNGRIKKLNYLGNLIDLKWVALPLIKNKDSIENIFNLLKKGKNKNKNIFGPMSEVVNNSLQYISKIDIINIAIYIKNIFNKNLINIKKIYIKKNKNLSKILFKKGKIIYKNNCLKCHGRFNLGKNFLSPKINWKYPNNIITMLEKTNNVNTINNFNIIMPNFSYFIKNNFFKYIINYLYFIKK